VNDLQGASLRHRSLESRLEIERLTSGSEGGCWKSALMSNSLAAYPTSRTVLKPSRSGDAPAQGDFSPHNEIFSEIVLPSAVVLSQPVISIFTFPGPKGLHPSSRWVHERTSLLRRIADSFLAWPFRSAGVQIYTFLQDRRHTL